MSIADQYDNGGVGHWIRRACKWMDFYRRTGDAKKRIKAFSKMREAYRRAAMVGK
jgi:hypothetical protein